MSTVFISYARADSEHARRLFSELVSAGHDAWLDTERLVGGARWKLEIPVAIRSASAFIAVLSKRSVNHRGFVQRELKEALEVLKSLPSNQVYLIPVRLEAVNPTEPELEDLAWIDLFPDFDIGFPKILKALSTIPAFGRASRSKKDSASASRLSIPFAPPWSIYKSILSMLPSSSKLLGGNNGLYLLLRTSTDGLRIPQHLREAHPETLAITLQYQYAKLKVGKETFTVTLSFSGKEEVLVIPFNAIVFMREESSGFECRSPNAG